MADTDTTAQPVLDLDALLASRTLLMVGGKGGFGQHKWFMKMLVMDSITH